MTSPRTRRFLQLGAAIAAAALVLRLPWLWNALEYDEIWSLQNYAPLSLGKILTDLGLPNNHPLNSLWLKCVAGSDSRPILRLHSVLAGVGTVIAGGWFALYWFRRRSAALWTMACLAVSSPLVGYSQAARGYSLQCFFLMLFALSAVSIRPRFRPRRAKYLPEIGVAASGVLAIWSVSSSALFLFPMSLAALWYGFRRWRRGEREYFGLTAFAVFGVFSLAWYASLWNVMKGAQGWATPITGAGMYLEAVTQVCGELGVPLAAVFLLAMYRRNRAVAAVALFPLAAAVWTNLGGARVYLPVAAAAAVMTGGLSARVKRLGWGLFTVFAALSLSVLDVWTATDWYRVYDEASALPEEVLVIYRATECYPVAKNNEGKADKDFFRRLTYAGNKPRKLVMVGTLQLSGTDLAGREQDIAPLDGPEIWIGGRRGRVASLTPLAGPPERGTLVVAMVMPVELPLASAVIRQLMAAGPCWALNGWLTRQLMHGNRRYRYLLAVFRADKPEAFTPELLKLPPKVLKLYRLEAGQ